MVILFWALRLILGFAVAVLLMFSWRASLAVAACLFFDVFGMIAAGARGGGLWNHSRLMFGVGLVLGAVLSIGRRRGNSWDIPALVLPVSLLLSASWMQDCESVGTLITVWPAYIASAVALPAGCLCVTSAVALIQQRIARNSWRS